jgi:hypothetical protein
MAIPDRPASTLTAAEAAAALRQHLEICRELLALAEQEHRALQQPGESSGLATIRARKTLLSRLEESNKALHEVGWFWRQLNATERQQHADIAALVRQNQQLIMKLVVLDRENEQAWLRRGLVPPHQMPPAQRQRPHFVADLYRQRNPR